MRGNCKLVFGLVPNGVFDVVGLFLFVDLVDYLKRDNSLE